MHCCSHQCLTVYSLPLQQHALETPRFSVCDRLRTQQRIRMAWPASMGPREATTHGYEAGAVSFAASDRDAEIQQSKYLKRRCRSTSCHGGQWIALGLLLFLVPSGALVYSPRLIPGGALGGRSSCRPSPTMGCVRSNARGHWLMASPRGMMLYHSQQTATTVRRLLTCFHSQLCTI